MALLDNVPFVASTLLMEISNISFSQSYRMTRNSLLSISTVGTSAFCSGWRAFAVKEATTPVPIAWARFDSLVNTSIDVLSSLQSSSSTVHSSPESTRRKRPSP